MACSGDRRPWHKALSRSLQTTPIRQLTRPYKKKKSRPIKLGPGIGAALELYEPPFVRVLAGRLLALPAGEGVRREGLREGGGDHCRKGMREREGWNTNRLIDIDTYFDLDIIKYIDR